MQRTALLGIGFCLLCCLSGCASNYAKHESLAKEFVTSTNELLDALEGVTDKDSAKAAAAKIDKICDRLEDVKKRVDALPKLADEENNRLQQALKPEVDKMMQRMRSVTMQAGIKSGAEPTLLKSLQRMSTIGKGMQR